MSINEVIGKAETTYNTIANMIKCYIYQFVNMVFKDEKTATAITRYAYYLVLIAVLVIAAAILYLTLKALGILKA